MFLDDALPDDVSVSWAKVVYGKARRSEARVVESLFGTRAAFVGTIPPSSPETVRVDASRAQWKVTAKLAIGDQVRFEISESGAATVNRE